MAHKVKDVSDLGAAAVTCVCTIFAGQCLGIWWTHEHLQACIDYDGEYFILRPNHTLI